MNKYYTNSKNEPEKFNEIRYNYRYDNIKIDEMTGKLLKQAKNDPEIKKKIKSKLIDVYGEIKNNQELRDYLKFNNLINDDNLPIFINESDDLELANEIKIYLITLPKKEFEKMKIN